MPWLGLLQERREASIAHTGKTIPQTVLTEGRTSLQGDPGNELGVWVRMSFPAAFGVKVGVNQVRKERWK